jgi:nitrate/nitrite transporter NarK
LLGAIADRAGARKKFMLAYAAMCLVRVLMMMGPIHVRGMRMDTAANTPTPIRK